MKCLGNFSQYQIFFSCPEIYFNFLEVGNALKAMFIFVPGGTLPLSKYCIPLPERGAVPCTIGTTFNYLYIYSKQHGKVTI